MATRQYSFLDNSMNRGAWQATVHGSESDMTEQLPLTYLEASRSRRGFPSCNAAGGVLVSLSQNQTCVPCIRRQILNYWTTKKVPRPPFSSQHLKSRWDALTLLGFLFRKSLGLLSADLDSKPGFITLPASGLWMTVSLPYFSEPPHFSSCVEMIMPILKGCCTSELR